MARAAGAAAPGAGAAQAREQLSRSARGAGMDWRRVLERAQLYAAAHAGLVPRVGLLDAQLGMALTEVFGAYVEEMRIFPEITRRKARQLAKAEAKTAGLEAEVKRAEAEAEEARQRLAESEGARGFIAAQGHRRDLELIELKRAVKRLEGAREGDLEQMTLALTAGREAAAALKALQGQKDETFTKTIGLRRELEEALRSLNEAEGRATMQTGQIRKLEEELEVAGKAEEQEVRRLARELGELKKASTVRELTLTRERAAGQSRGELLEKREAELEELHEQAAAARLGKKEAALELQQQRKKLEAVSANLDASAKRAMELEEEGHTLREQLLALRSQHRDTEAALHEATLELRRVRGGEAASWLVGEAALLAEVAAIEPEAASAAGLEARLAAAQAELGAAQGEQYKAECAAEEAQRRRQQAEEERDAAEAGAAAAMDSAAAREAEANQSAAAAHAELAALAERAEAAEAALQALQRARDDAPAGGEARLAALEAECDELRALVEGGAQKALVQRVFTDAAVLVGGLWELEVDYAQLLARRAAPT